MANTMGPLGRITQSILDLDYGDEQERLRYYETYAIVVHLQLIALPVIAAVVIGVAGRSATGPVLVMLGTAFAPVLFGLVHLTRHNVRTESIAMSGRNRGYMIAYALSCSMLVLAFAARSSGSELRSGFGIGAALGLGVGLAVAVAMAVRRQRDVNDDADPEF
ncbi:MAG: hypothetical protein GY925_29980 [Actinomycetia bacterium]|nr:hypothetical protein [Actinomycetes bacterium]